MQTAFNFSAPRKRYPSVAGSKVSGPSQEAARSIDALTLRRMVVGVLRSCGAVTADECAARLELSVLAIRSQVQRAQAVRRDRGLRAAAQEPLGEVGDGVAVAMITDLG